MFVAAIVMGLLCAYYFGLRPGLYAAVATLVLCVAALFVPKYAIVFYLLVGAGGVGAYLVGSRRPVPTQSVMAVRFVRKTIKQAMSALDTKRKQ